MDIYLLALENLMFFSFCHKYDTVGKKDEFKGFSEFKKGEKKKKG